MCAATLKNSMEVPQKIKNGTTIWSVNLTSGKYPKELTSGSWRDISLALHVHCSAIYNSQYVKTNQMPNDRWVNTENVVYTHKDILFSLRREGNSVTNDNTDEPWGYSAKWNKWDTERKKSTVLHDSTYMRYLNSLIHKVRALEWWLPGTGEGEMRSS